MQKSVYNYYTASQRRASTRDARALAALDGLRRQHPAARRGDRDAEPDPPDGPARALPARGARGRVADRAPGMAPHPPGRAPGILLAHPPGGMAGRARGAPGLPGGPGAVGRPLAPPDLRDSRRPPRGAGPAAARADLVGPRSALEEHVGHPPQPHGSAERARRRAWAGRQRGNLRGGAPGPRPGPRARGATPGTVIERVHVTLL